MSTNLTYECVVQISSRKRSEMKLETDRTSKHSVDGCYLMKSQVFGTLIVGNSYSIYVCSLPLIFHR